MPIRGWKTWSVTCPANRLKTLPGNSGSILVSMAETRRAGVPNFTGGEAAAITQQGNPFIFRTSFTQSTAMPKVARYIKDTVKAKMVAAIIPGIATGMKILHSICRYPAPSISAASSSSFGIELK